MAFFAILIEEDSETKNAIPSPEVLLLIPRDGYLFVDVLGDIELEKFDAR